jgi:thiol-disulfide isomerase/thioredoxin
MEPGLIGGGASRYYNWDRAKFDQAVADGKTVYLEFSANWCGTCKAQEPHLIAGFAELNDPNVVGFKIPYKDSDTTAEHTELAKQYGIAYQHTKVVLKDGKQVLKSPEAWDNVRFLAEMRKLG